VTNLSGRDCCDIFAAIRTFANFAHLKKKVLSEAGFKERDQNVVSKVPIKSLSQLPDCILGRRRKKRKKKKEKKNLSQSQVQFGTSQ